MTTLDWSNRTENGDAVMVYLCKKIDLGKCIFVDKTKNKIDTRKILQTNIGNNYFKQFINYPSPQTLYIIIQED